MRKIIIKSIVLLLILSVISCASKGPKSPYEASTSSILFGGKSVKMYLASRRAQLREIEQKIEDLDEQLLLNMGEIYNLEQILAKQNKILGAHDKQLNELNNQVAYEKSKLSKIYNKVQSLEGTISKLNQEKDTLITNREKDQNSINSLKQSIASLEKESLIFKKSINRTLRLKIELYERENNE